MEAFLQAKLTDLERAAYIEFLSTVPPEVIEEGVENVIRQFRPERTRLPLPAEFLEFCPETPKSQREQEARRRARWRLEYEMQNRDGSVDRAREEFRRQLRALVKTRGL